MAGDEAAWRRAFNEFISTDSRYSFAEEKEFRSEDATKVSLSLLGIELVEGKACGIGTWY